MLYVLTAQGYKAELNSAIEGKSTKGDHRKDSTKSGSDRTIVD